MATLGDKPTILAVDDTPENLDVVKGILAPRYVVKAAINGEMALRVARSQPPDLILLDVMMPDMDGYEVCRRLKADPATRAIPVIFLTAKGQVTDEAEGLALGAADYILKPVNAAILAARVHTHLSLQSNLSALSDAYEVIKSQKERMQEELDVARGIQMSMLPLDFSGIPGHEAVSVFAALEPAREVGGDFYDFFPVDDDHLCLCIGDVSGKGVPAALFMAITKTLLKSRAYEDHSPASILTYLNSELCEDNPSCMFVTAFLAILDERSGELTYTNAGHDPPYILRSTGSVDRAEGQHGPVVGAVEDLVYDESSLLLSPGDLVFTYTDGVTEEVDAAGRAFGQVRLRETLAGAPAHTAAAVVQHTMQAVAGLRGPTAQADDVTVLAVRYSERGSERVERTFSIENRIAQMSVVEREVEAFVERHAIPAGVATRIELALDELVSNALRYAFDDDRPHRIQITLELIGRRVAVTIDDDGAPFNPLCLPAPDTAASLEDREPGGLGIHLVRTLIGRVTYRRRIGRNVLRLEVPIESTGDDVPTDAPVQQPGLARRDT